MATRPASQPAMGLASLKSQTRH